MDVIVNESRIGQGHPVYLVAEMSGNHNQSYEKAVEILHAAKETGADAVKLQTYTADTMTIDCDGEFFQVQGGTLWDGYTLHGIYKEAYTPWEWQPKLKEVAEGLGMDIFSTPFDVTAVDFLEELEMPAYKVASPEVMDHPLLERIARTGKPVIMSTGMASLAEIDEAVGVLRGVNEDVQIVLLKCTAAYPALPEEMNLAMIPHLMETFRIPIGLSDHTLGMDVSVASVALGACMIEKHFTLDRNDQGPDSDFSMEPEEFAQMVKGVRTVEKAVGTIRYGPSDHEKYPKEFRRSLFVAEDVPAGELLTQQNVRCVRPGQGLHTKHLTEIVGNRARRDLRKGEPLSWDLIDFLTSDDN